MHSPRPNASRSSADPPACASSLTELIEDERFLRQLEHEPAQVAIHDTRERIVWANHAYRTAVGLAGKALPDTPCYEVWGLEGPCPQCAVRQAIRRGTSTEATLTPRSRPDWPLPGGHWLSKATPIQNRSGTVIGAIETAYDIGDKDTAREILAESQRRVLHKLDAYLLSSTEETGPSLQSVIDIPAVQAIMDDFYQLTGIGIAIVDLEGKVLVATGWQDICTKFHRIHPETSRHCIESDTVLSRGVTPGTFRAYRCKNNMWDIVTPIRLGEKHVGNLFLGQFFYEDDIVDREVFRAQAERYGFDVDAYLDALDRVPRWSRERVETVMRFYAKFATLLSSVSYSNLQLAETLTERDELLASLRESEATWREYVENAPYGVFVTNEKAEYLRVNTAACRITGYSEDELMQMSIPDLIPPDRLEEGFAHFRRLVDESESVGDTPFLHKNGEPRIWRVAAVRLAADRFLGFVEDITEQRAREAEHEQLQHQLQQAQKIESIGRLAGGVAHDFNNMLNVILGHAELALDALGPHDSAQESLQEIKRAAQRSANLTRQLLAFARRQTVLPQILDLNEVIGGTLKMLRRLIGEHIDLLWRPGADLWRVKVDASQMDQLLANLAVNARDAIAEVGTLTIETANAILSSRYCDGHPYATPGEYVRITVRDNGCGMDTKTLEQVFEPFFTTKEVGQGTGLGLATVYGIVKQNKGFIDIVSTPGEGTTVEIHLPRCRQEAERDSTHPASAPGAGRTSTVLMVEDEAAILALGRQMLESLGYRVLSASTPKKALEIAEQLRDQGASPEGASPEDASPKDASPENASPENARPEDASGMPIDLLMTDVVMPGMSGWELAGHMCEQWPGLKTLFMSGYPAEQITDEGILRSGVHFIAKPFSMTELAAKVREALEAETISKQARNERKENERKDSEGKGSQGKGSQGKDS